MRREEDAAGTDGPAARRVCLLCDSLSSTDGPGRHASNLIRAMAPSLGRMEVFVPGGHGRIDGDLEARCRIHRALPSRHLFYLHPALAFPLVAAKAVRVAPAARRSDVVHSIKDYPFSLIAALAAAVARRPLVVTVHGTYATLPFAYRAHRAALAYTYRRARAILCVSRHTRDRLLPFVPAEKLEVIPNGVDPRLLAHPAATDPAEADPPYLLTVGLVRERKGLDVSVEAFLRIAGEHPRLRYRIAGRYDDDGAVVAGLRAAATDHPAGDRVELLGAVDDDELARLYAGCSVFVMTPRTDRLGRFEGFGLVYLEAGAFSKPVVGATGCGAEDAIVDGETGLLVPPEDPEATADALRALLGSPELRRRLGARGRALAERSTWSATASRVTTVYREHLQG